MIVFDQKEGCLLLWMSSESGHIKTALIVEQLEKNDVVPTSSQDEALARYSVSREVPYSVLKWETVLG